MPDPIFGCTVQYVPMHRFSMFGFLARIYRSGYVTFSGSDLRYICTGISQIIWIWIARFSLCPEIDRNQNLNMFYPKLDKNLNFPLQKQCCCHSAPAAKTSSKRVAIHLLGVFIFWESGTSFSTRQQPPQLCGYLAPLLLFFSVSVRVLLVDFKI